MDLIEIDELRVRCVLGVTAEERRDRQEVLIGLRVGVDARPAMAADGVESVWDYRTAAKAVIARVESSRWYTVERLAGEVARVCVGLGARYVMVRVDKPGALRFARSVGLVIERRQQDFPDLAGAGAGSARHPDGAAAVGVVG